MSLSVAYICTKCLLTMFGLRYETAFFSSFLDLLNVSRRKRKLVTISQRAHYAELN